MTKAKDVQMCIEQRAAGASLRTIAKQAGVNASTVQRALRALDIATPASITGHDGKRYGKNVTPEQNATRTDTPVMEKLDAENGTSDDTREYDPFAEDAASLRSQAISNAPSHKTAHERQQERAAAIERSRAERRQFAVVNGISEDSAAIILLARKLEQRRLLPEDDRWLEDFAREHDAVLTTLTPPMGDVR